MAFKPASQNNGPTLNYDRVNKSFEDSEIYPAYVSLIIDVGTQQPEPVVSKDYKTYVRTKDERKAHAAEVTEIASEYNIQNDKLLEWEEIEVTAKNIEEIQKQISDVELGEEIIAIDSRIYTPAKCRQLVIAADMYDHEVEYIDNQPVKFRYLFNPQDFKTRDLKGLPFKLAKKAPTDKYATYEKKSRLYDLIQKTGMIGITTTDDHETRNDITQILGKSIGLQCNVNRKGDKAYPKFKGSMLSKSQREQYSTADLDVEPMLIQFDEVTLDQLKIAKPNASVIKLIKKSLDYEGSQMQKCIEQYEELRNSGGLDSTKAEEKPKVNNSKEVDQEDEPKPKKKKEVEVDQEEEDDKPPSRSVKKEVESKPDDEYDDDIPF